MAITALALAQQALLLLAAGQQNSPWLSMELEALQAINYAMHEFGEEVADDPDRFGLLQQDYTVTLTSGSGSLVTATGSITTLADMLWDTTPRGRVKNTENNETLRFIPEVADFEGNVLRGFQYYTIRQGNIYTRGSVGDYTTDYLTVLGPLTVTANYFPSVGTVNTLPSQIEDDAVRFLARVLAEKFPKMKGAA